MDDPVPKLNDIRVEYHPKSDRPNEYHSFFSYEPFQTTAKSVPVPAKSGVEGIHSTLVKDATDATCSEFFNLSDFRQL